MRRFVGFAALAAGGLGLVWPVLVAPIQSDSRYHYLLAATNVKGSVAGLVRWTIDDIQWRAERGRIAPVGTFAQHAVYASGGEFAAATGVDLYWFHAGVKLALLVASVLTFWLLLRALRLPGGRPLPAGARHTGLVVFTFMWAIGPQLDEIFRSGWTTFPMLTIGAVIVTFGLGATVLWVLNRWPQAGAVRRLLLVLLVGLAGAVLTSTYELHYAALPFALILLLAQGTSHPTFRASLRSKALIGGTLAISFLVPLAAIRLYLRDLGCPRGCYPGLEPDLGLHVVRVAALQLFNALPGYGAPRMWLRTQKNGVEPGFLVQPGWLFALLLVAGVWLLLRRRAAASNTNAADTTAAASAPTPTPRELAPLQGAAAVTALVAAVIMSISKQAHEIVVGPGIPWRCTPLVWAMVAAAAAALGIWLVPRLAGGGGRQRFWLAALFVVPAFVVGGAVWPLSAAIVELERNRPSVRYVESIHHEVARGDLSTEGDARRCALAAPDEGRTRRPFLLVRQGGEKAFRYHWGRPFCSTAPMPEADVAEDAAGEG